MLNLAKGKEILKVKSKEVKPSDSNKVCIKGVIEDNLEFSHEVCGEKFYKSRVAVKRDSGVADYVPLIISEREIDLKKLSEGVLVEISGQLRSHINKEKIKNRLEHFLFVKSIKVFDNEGIIFKNVIFLDGYVCKPTVLRKTPSGKIISDIFVAVNREYNKSDYIPAIAWGRMAYYAERLEVGDRIQLIGRIQSRMYITKLGQEERELYEISIMDIEKFNK
ncbi:MAG: single-stranded DNA-binding protein [Clostridia bacterium]|nr:single-stranded DNA-binding protein [Clostridia bacterium]